MAYIEIEWRDLIISLLKKDNLAKRVRVGMTIFHSKFNWRIFATYSSQISCQRLNDFLMNIWAVTSLTFNDYALKHYIRIIIIYFEYTNCKDNDS